MLGALDDVREREGVGCPERKTRLASSFSCAGAICALERADFTVVSR